MVLWHRLMKLLHMDRTLTQGVGFGRFHIPHTAVVVKSLVVLGYKYETYDPLVCRSRIMDVKRSRKNIMTTATVTTR